MGVKHDEYTKRKDLSPYDRQNLRNPEHHKARRYNKHKEYITKNPEKAKLYAFRGRLKRRGITEDQYNNFLKSQNNLCAICQGTNEEASKDWAIDHCHDTGKVRGLLCQSCNVMLGFSKDNINTLQKAIEYLKTNG